MSQKRRRKKVSKPLEIILAIIIIAGSVFAYYFYNEVLANSNIELTDSVQDGVSVHFIDVGQGDSTLIQVEDKNILIDAGENDKGSLVVDYLHNQGVTEIDLLIATHPHSDHIGGLDVVVENFDIGEIIMPELNGDNIPTTKTYLDLLAAIDNKGYSITAATSGQVYGINQAHLSILGPIDEYSNLNNDSVVSKFQYGDISFLFCGDVEKEAENDLLELNTDLSATVLHVNHHGSSTSNTEKFLESVNAQCYVISVGSGNSYGHPHAEIIERLGDKYIYRTDEQGSIVFTTDGKELSVKTER